MSAVWFIFGRACPIPYLFTRPLHRNDIQDQFFKRGIAVLKNKKKILNQEFCQVLKFVEKAPIKRVGIYTK